MKRLLPPARQGSEDLVAANVAAKATIEKVAENVGSSSGNGRGLERCLICEQVFKTLGFFSVHLLLIFVLLTRKLAFHMLRFKRSIA